MPQAQLAKWLVIIALALIVIAIVIYFFGDKLGWIGNLPGDIRIERENVNIYIPITTMILASLLLNLLLRIFSKG